MSVAALKQKTPTGYYLSTSEFLIERLNALDDAKITNDVASSRAIVEEILRMVQPGTYVGYPEGSSEPCVVTVSSPYRKGEGANTHSFWVRVTQNSAGISKIIHMELVNFLAEIMIAHPITEQEMYRGRRFWVK